MDKNKYGLIPIEEGFKGKTCFYIYEGDASMKNWIGFVEFDNEHNYKISSFRKNVSLTEQLELCRLCGETAWEMKNNSMPRT